VPCSAAGRRQSRPLKYGPVGAWEWANPRLWLVRSSARARNGMCAPCRGSRRVWKRGVSRPWRPVVTPCREIRGIPAPATLRVIAPRISTFGGGSRSSSPKSPFTFGLVQKLNYT